MTQHPALADLRLPPGWQFDNDPIVPGAPEAQVEWSRLALKAVIAHPDITRRWTLNARFQLFAVTEHKNLVKLGSTDEFHQFLTLFKLSCRPEAA